MNPLFLDRADAGRQLAEKLTAYEARPDVLVLGLPRGGVPVAYEAAQALGVPLDIFVVRKLGVPGHEELAMGAIASGGVRVLNENVLQHLSIARWVVEAATTRELDELRRREQAYRSQRPPLSMRGKTVVLVDDGLATGSTMRAAIGALRQREVKHLVVAVPVGSIEACAELRPTVDDFICLAVPEDFRSVGEFYEDFGQTSDDEVRELLFLGERPAPSTQGP